MVVVGGGGGGWWVVYEIRDSNSTITGLAPISDVKSEFQNTRKFHQSSYWKSVASLLKYVGLAFFTLVWCASHGITTVVAYVKRLESVS